MKMRVCVAFLLLALPLWAQSVVDEAQGTGEAEPRSFPEPSAAARAQARGVMASVGLLLIPESTNDRVMAFDPITGNLVDPDFIPSDPDNLSTPIEAIAGITPGTILVSDQLEDVVQAYDLDGNYLGVFAPAGGADLSILDNIRGIALSPQNTLLVSVGSGTNEDAIAEFDANGNYLGNFIANGAGGLDSPFDVFLRGGDVLVPGITSDNIIRYDFTGNPLGVFSPVDNFPEQVAEAGNGNILVGNFSGAQEGVVEFTSAGALVGVYDSPSLGGYRGAYELPNGNILTTNGGGVHELDRMGNLVETKISGVSARFITFFTPQECGQATMDIVPGQNIVIVGEPGCVYDLYDSNCSADVQSWSFLGTFTIGQDGSVDTGIVAAPDTCYVLTDTGSLSLIAEVRTVPTLGTWGLIAFLLLITAAAVVFMRRRRLA